jgi:hypothetical protein
VTLKSETPLAEDAHPFYSEEEALSFIGEKSLGEIWSVVMIKEPAQ